MKSFFTTLSVFAIGSVFALNACVEVTETEIVGVWEETNLDYNNTQRQMTNPEVPPIVCQIERYNADHSFTMQRRYEHSNNEYRTSLGGTYKVEMGILSLDFNGVNSKGYVVPVVERYHISLNQGLFYQHGIDVLAGASPVSGTPPELKDLNHFKGVLKPTDANSYCIK